jgi:hypothetical protein
MRVAIAVLLMAAVSLGGCSVFLRNPPEGEGRARPINEGPWPSAHRGLWDSWMEPPTEPVPTTPPPGSEPRTVP